MSEEKVPELEIEQSEVEPIELPEGRRRTETGDQQSFGEDPRKVAPKEEKAEPEVPENDSGKFPRATKRRSHKAKMKDQKAQRAQMHKMQQEMMQPIRRRDLMGVFQQINQFLIHPKVEQLQAAVDKLMLIPDFIGNCVNDEGRFDIEPSLESFEEFYESYMKKLEEEETERKAAEEEAAGSETSPSEPTSSQESTRDGGEAPSTEETQTE